MKMSIIISFLLFFTTACKNDTNSTQPVKQDIHGVEKVDVKQGQKIESVVENVNNNGSSEVENKDLEKKKKSDTNKSEKKIEKKNNKTATKSVPKPQNPDKIVVLEKVELDVKGDTETKDKSVPKPVIKETKEVIEQVDSNNIKEVEKPKVNISHNKFDALLSKYVSSNGDVNYAGLKQDITMLQVYLDDLSAADIGALSKNEKLAFWINAYNAYTLKLIVDNYPVNSITDLEGGKPWDKKWINLNGKTLSLNNIENDIIRPQFKEPRIHFAVNCAAKSCPPLLNKAWTSNNLEANFEKQTKKFVNNSQYNSISENAIQISKIFDWYGVDFGDVISFLNKYSTTKISTSTEIKFQEYNWALNKK